EGVAPEFAAIRSLTIAEGRFLNRADIDGERQVAVLGAEVRRRLFGGRPALNEMITVQGLPFRVVGLMPKKEQNSMYYAPDDEVAVVPWTVARRALGLPYVENLVVQPVDIAGYERTEKAVKETIGAALGLTPDDPQILPCWNTVKSAADARTLFTA